MSVCVSGPEKQQRLQSVPTGPRARLRRAVAKRSPGGPVRGRSDALPPTRVKRCGVERAALGAWGPGERSSKLAGSRKRSLSDQASEATRFADVDGGGAPGDQVREARLVANASAGNQASQVSAL